MILLRRLHLVIGLVAILAFVLTGQYMDRFHGHLQEMSPAPRLLFRSSHIYLLFSGLLNCALGIARMTEPVLWRRTAATLGSLLVLATPVLFLIAFFREPWMDGLIRPFARPAIYISLAGVLLHLLAQVPITSRQAEKRTAATS